MKWAARALVLLATAAGAGAGLYYSWVVDPVEYVDTAPDSLRTPDKLVYLALVGDLYAHEGDLALARERLADLDVAADGDVLAGFVEIYLEDGGRLEAVRPLARLAQDLGASGGVLRVFEGGGDPVPATAVAAASPEATSTPLPTPTPLPSFFLVEQTALCAEPGAPGRIGVWVLDAVGEPLPGVQVRVAWPAGEDDFFTGLHPGESAGYGDFEMAPSTEYELSLLDFRSDVARGLTANVAPGLCRAGVEAVNWRLTFQEAE
ncbi:MAG: hypothetical protein PVG11_02830 [Anaerolineae bacterium]|jgi:hypothetical protein